MKERVQVRHFLLMSRLSLTVCPLYLQNGLPKLKIYLDSDGRFPTGRQELVLRRTIGLKKDEYSLDRKSASKSEVDQLLESAGFSKANPYYIVPQGRVCK